MLFFQLDRQAVKVVRVSREAETGNGWVSRWDFKSFETAQRVAAMATAALGKLYIAIDSGEFHAPRYDVIEAPEVGVEVSRYFNGDGYPAGKIVKISKSLRRVETDQGVVFFRRKMTGAWVNNGTWSMIVGVNNDRNPHF